MRREFEQKTNTSKTIREILRNKQRIHLNLFNYIGSLLIVAILFLLDTKFKCDFTQKAKDKIANFDFETCELFQLLSNESIPQFSKFVYERESLNELIKFGFTRFFQKINGRNWLQTWKAKKAEEPRTWSETAKEL